MKGCHKWVLLCLLGVAVLVLLLPEFNRVVAAMPVWVLVVLMVGCCAAPIAWSATSAAKSPGGSRCGAKQSGRKGEEDAGPKDRTKPPCH